MPDQLQLRGGTTTEHNSFTGASKEVTVDTTKKTLVVHDGATQGGTPLMKESGATAASTVQIGTGGIERLKLGSSEVVVNETGTNTDFRVEGDNNINLLFCDAGNDRVGIGLNNPASTLEVNGATKSNVNANDGASTAIRTANSGTGTTIASYGFASGNSQKASIRAHVLGNGAMMFHNNNDTEKMRIDASGNVGIGTTSPTAKLHIENISGDSHLVLKGINYGVNYRRGSDNALIGFTGNGGAVNLGASNLGISAPNAAGNIVFQTAGTTATDERMRITPTGKVGIGLTDPDQKLEVDGIIKGSSYFQGGASATAANNFHFGAEGDGTFRIYKGNYGAGTERFRIDASGNVGIGTSSPGNMLHVSQSGTGQLIKVATTSNNTRAQIECAGKEADGTLVRCILGGDGDFGGMVFTNSNHKLGFSTNNAAPQMTLDTAGKLGIGTTGPAGYNANASDIVINRAGNAGITINTATNGIGRIAFGDANDNNIGQIRYAHSENNMLFDVNAAERMRIDAGGRILFNMTAPLDTVAGSLNMSGGTYGARIAMQGTTTNAGSNIAEFFAHWDTNKVAGFTAKSGTDTTNKDDGELAFFTRASGGSLTERLNIATTGRIRVPVVYSTAGSSMRDVQIESDGNLCGLSSITAAKTNITDLTDVSWIYNLKPKSFNFRKKTVDPVTGVNTYLDEAEDEKAHGFLAEDVETINKDFCFYDKDSEGKDVLAGVYYKTMVVPLIKAVQDLKAENTSLAERLAALEAK